LAVCVYMRISTNAMPSPPVRIPDRRILQESPAQRSHDSRCTNPGLRRESCHDKRARTTAGACLGERCNAAAPCSKGGMLRTRGVALDVCALHLSLVWHGRDHGLVAGFRNHQCAVKHTHTHTQTHTHTRFTTFYVGDHALGASLITTTRTCFASPPHAHALLTARMRGDRHRRISAACRRVQQYSESAGKRSSCVAVGAACAAAWTLTCP